MASTSEKSNGSSKPIRKFAVEPVETMETKSRKGGDAPKLRRKFAPQLEETSSKSHHSSLPSSRSGETESAPQTPTRPRARFAPQLIETATRSRRRGDTIPATKHTDKTDISPGDAVHLPRHMRMTRPGPLPAPPENTPAASRDDVPQLSTESKYSHAKIAKKTPRATSFRKPTLECINASDSDDSKLPSLSNSPSTKSDETEHYKHASRVRESCDDRFSGYLLALAARVAENQLKEQAMAAYPNENTHEPVDHFAVDRDSDNSDGEEGFGMLSQAETPQTFSRRESAAGWDMQEMRRHKEMLEKQRQEGREAEAMAKPKKQGGALPDFKSPFDTAGSNGLPNASGALRRHPAELKQMQDAAKPPLLGTDLIFRSCPSPKLTHIDAYQKPRARREGGRTSESRQHSGLWTPVTASPVITRNNSSTGGLWNGVCDITNSNSLAVPGMILQSGLLTPMTATPAKEIADPMQSLFVGIQDQLPASPTSLNIRLTGIDDVLVAEAALDEEFPDSFVTQVYNYLSLGYPALAQKFDGELSKISKLALEEIRRDDQKKNSKGYVDLPEGDGPNENFVKEVGGRWRALRLYVREWGRQENRMKGHLKKPFGQAVRRGSWLA